MEDQFNRNLGEASGSWALGERLDLSKEQPTQPLRMGMDMRFLGGGTRIMALILLTKLC